MGNRGWKCVRERERGESEREIKVKMKTGMRITVDGQEYMGRMRHSKMRRDREFGN